MGLVTLYWDQRPKSFDEEKLETAWLTWDGDETIQGTLKLSKKLISEGWSKSEAREYAIAIRNKLWEPKEGK